MSIGVVVVLDVGEEEQTGEEEENTTDAVAIAFGAGGLGSGVNRAATTGDEGLDSCCCSSSTTTSVVGEAMEGGEEGRRDWM